MKNILKFLLGSFLIVSAGPIAIASHHFAISTFPFLSSGDGYNFLVKISCTIYAAFQGFTGLIIADESFKKIFG